KSGTAQLPKATGGGYHEDRYISSFIAGAPLESPRLVVLCVIEDPDKRIGPYYGGRVAGPVVRDVMDHALAYLGVTPDQDQVEGFPDLLAGHDPVDP
ncbi:MAG TPA: penicillin-binding protein, partial [Phycisphaerales bacterium]|nr:penicillin-binding protein [Phycisphaerales bacterium]